MLREHHFHTDCSCMRPPASVIIVLSPCDRTPSRSEGGPTAREARSDRSSGSPRRMGSSACGGERRWSRAARRFPRIRQGTARRKFVVDDAIGPNAVAVAVCGGRSGLCCFDAVVAQFDVGHQNALVSSSPACSRRRETKRRRCPGRESYVRGVRFAPFFFVGIFAVGDAEVRLESAQPSSDFNPTF